MVLMWPSTQDMTTVLGNWESGHYWREPGVAGGIVVTKDRRRKCFSVVIASVTILAITGYISPRLKNITITVVIIISVSVCLCHGMHMEISSLIPPRDPGD